MRTRGRLRFYWVPLQKSSRVGGEKILFFHSPLESEHQSSLERRVVS